jgi:hypothetical protein
VPPIIKFSEPIFLGNGEGLTDGVRDHITFADSQGNLVEFTTNWMLNSSSIKVNPVMQLKSHETYTITINENTFFDKAGIGNKLTTLFFRTEYNPLIFDHPLSIPQIEIEKLFSFDLFNNFVSHKKVSLQ